jgi:uncharacterized protein (TIGR03437 family)
MKSVVSPLLLAAFLPLSLYAQSGEGDVPCRVTVSGASQADAADVATGLLKRDTALRPGSMTPAKPFPAGLPVRCQQLESQFVQTAALRAATASEVRHPRSRWVIADFNGDGRTDSLVLNGRGFTRQLALSTGGTESPAEVTLGPAGHNYTVGAAADVNGDGRQDLVLCCSGVSNESRLVVAFGNGNGTFQAPQDSILGSGRFDLRDWNGDGRQDVIALALDGTLRVAFGQPNGTFSIARTTLGATDHTAMAIDINGDSFLDVVTLGPNVVKVFFGSSGGNFGFFSATPLPIQGANNMIAADYNGDGRLDLAVSEPLGAMVMLFGAGGVDFNLGRIFSTGSFEVPEAAEFGDSGRMALLLPDATAPSLQAVPFNSAGVPLAPPLYRLAPILPEYPVYDRHRSTSAVADFDGDGKDDLVLFAPIQSTGFLQVFRGGPLLSLAPQQRIEIPPVNTSAVSIPKMLPGDFNGDNRADLAVMETETQRLLVYMTNQFTGEFSAPQVLDLNGIPRDFALADFNNDGKLDVVVATGLGVPGAGSIGVHTGVGNGTFSAPQNIAIPNGLTPYQLAVGDFNGDFKQDIAFILIANSGTSNAAGFVLNRTNNQFQQPTLLSLPAHNGIGQTFGLDAIAVGDFNSDGGRDILIAAPFVNAGQLLVFNGNGQGAFTAKPNLPVAPGVAMMILRDVDADGNLDILASHCCNDTTTSIYYGRPNGTISARHIVPTGPQTGRIALGDLNGDGRLDLVAHTRAGVSVQPFYPAAEGDVVNAASGSGPTVAIDSIASFYGSGLAPFAEAALAEVVQGTRVFITDSAGKHASGTLFYASPGLVNFSIPAGLAEGPAIVTVAPAQGNASFAEITLARVAPGVFVAGTQPFVASNVITVKANGQQLLSSPYRPEGLGLAPVPIDLGPSTDKVLLLLYATGVRGRTGLNQVNVTIGGVAATVEYAGVQNSYPGFDQLNVVIPRALIGRGMVDVVVTVEGKTANIGRVAIQ